MRRSTGITVTAIAAALGSVFGVLMLVILAFTFTNQTPPAGTDPTIQRIGLLMAGGMILVFTAWALATSMGLWKLYRWARMSALIYFGVLVGISAFTSLLIALMPFPPGPDGAQVVTTTIRVFMTSIYLMGVLLGAIGLYYFNRPSVKEQFENTGGPATPRKRPLSISIIAWLFLSSAATCVAAFLLKSPAMVLGMTFSGVAAQIYYTIFTALMGWTGIALLKLRPAGRIVAIALISHGLLNSLLLLLPSVRERALAASMAATRPDVAQLYGNPAFVLSIVIGASLPSLIAIWFLVKAGDAFVAPEDLPSPTNVG